MNKDWFIDWFNTTYYHTLYQHRDESEACRFIDNLCAHLKIESGAKILDLACGKGRHAIHLAKKGYQTTGVDLAKQSIDKAKENTIANVSFDVHDMRNTYIKNGFDYVFNLFTSFGYFETKNENIEVQSTSHPYLLCQLFIKMSTFSLSISNLLIEVTLKVFDNRFNRLMPSFILSID